MTAAARWRKIESLSLSLSLSRFLSPSGDNSHDIGSRETLTRAHLLPSEAASSFFSPGGPRPWPQIFRFGGKGRLYRSPTPRKRKSEEVARSGAVCSLLRATNNAACDFAFSMNSCRHDRNLFGGRARAIICCSLCRGEFYRAFKEVPAPRE